MGENKKLSFETGSLFEAQALNFVPLAERLRPQCLEDLAGQDHLTGEGSVLRAFLEEGKGTSLILWGPPGCGKTTLARLLAGQKTFHFESVSAVFSGVQDLKKIFEASLERFHLGKPTLLFVDEIHRFNKTQQDTFLPYVESGALFLVGATTENPSFNLTAALLSRCQVLTFNPLDPPALEKLLQRAEGFLERPLPIDEGARSLLKTFADGDGRALLNGVDVLLSCPSDPHKPLTKEALGALLHKRAPLYDRHSDHHYNLISALHKAVRGSDVDAALYWFARMLAGGEDPLYLGRRLIRMACEDIGLADPQALGLVLQAVEAYERLGSPEGELALAQGVVCLATAPKSNAVYLAFKKVTRCVHETGSLPPPKSILNAPTAFMEKEGYGAGYLYDHDIMEGFSGQNYFPEGLERPCFYAPVNRGFEREVRKRLEYWQTLRKRKAQSK